MRGFDVEFKTLGEAAAGRPLKMEKRSGVDHYVIGQHSAKIEPKEDPNIEVAVLTYCSPLGVVVLPVVRVFGRDWEPALPKLRLVGVRTDYGIRSLPDDFVMTDEMLEALKEAEG